MENDYYDATKKSRYVCSNCEVAIKKHYIDVWHRAGFGIQHMECPNCGQTQTIIDKKNE